MRHLAGPVRTAWTLLLDDRIGRRGRRAAAPSPARPPTSIDTENAALVTRSASPRLLADQRPPPARLPADARNSPTSRRAAASARRDIVRCRCVIDVEEHRDRAASVDSLQGRALRSASAVGNDAFTARRAGCASVARAGRADRCRSARCAHELQRCAARRCVNDRPPSRPGRVGRDARRPRLAPARQPRRARWRRRRAPDRNITRRRRGERPAPAPAATTARGAAAAANGRQIGLVLRHVPRQQILAHVAQRRDLRRGTSGTTSRCVLDAPPLARRRTRRRRSQSVVHVHRTWLAPLK